MLSRAWDLSDGSRTSPVLMLGTGVLTERIRIEWRWREAWCGYWGRWLGQHRVYWHAGPLIISWRRRD